MKVIVVHEKVFESWAKDAFTFGFLFAGWYLNHRFAGGSWLIDLMIGVFVFIGAVSRAQKQYTPIEAEVALRDMARRDTKESQSTAHNKRKGEMPVYF
jgi:hypothetical protein